MKKILSLALTACLAVSLLVGCGGSGNSGGSTSSSSGGSSDNATEASSGGGETLSMLINCAESDAALALYQEMVDDFNANNEYGVTINMEYIDNSNFKTKLSTLMASNEVPDIFFTWELGYLQNFVNGGKVLSLNPYLEADAAWADSMIEGSLDSFTFDGETYGVPYIQSIAVMHYNKQIFEENGLSVPTTYEEYRNVCDTLKAAGITPVALASTPADAWLVSQYIEQLSNGIAGYDLYKGLVDGSGKWNDPAFVEAAKLFVEEVNAGYFEDGFTGVGNDEAQDLFEYGNAAMYFNGSWVTSSLDSEEFASVAGNVGSFAMPPVKAGNEGINIAASDYAFAVSANCANPDAAVAFLKLVTGQKFQEKAVYEYGKMPAAKLDIDTSKVSDLFADTLNAMNNTKGVTCWYDRVDTDMGNEFNNICVGISNGDDPQEAFDSLQEYFESK